MSYCQNGEPLDTAAIRREHFQSPHGDCHKCGSLNPLPCDAFALCAEVDVLRARLAAVEALCDKHDDGYGGAWWVESVRAAARGEGDRPAPSSIVRLTGFQTQLDAARGEDK